MTARTVAGALALAVAAAMGAAVGAQAQETRPNILLVLLDDAGFMDFGAYGSDTATPNMDRLGETGAMLTRYYTTPQCGPSRAALMTGQDNHVIGMGSIAEVMSSEMEALPEYRLTWGDDQQTLASRLRDAGYQTFVSGKWGIGHVGANLPHRFGFDRSWVLDSTGSSNFNTRSYLPIYKEMKWFEDGEHVPLPEDFYSSRNIVDKMMDYVDAADPDAPFFGFLSFQAIHIPLQVSRAYIDKYDGVFDLGWDVMREERRRRAIELGLVPETTRLSDGAWNDRRWDDLSAEEQRYWARAMQVNAGMMEAADAHLGRLLDHLEAQGRLENTIVVVTSDNGPEFNTLGKTSTQPLLAIEQAWMSLVGWDTDYDNLGQLGSIAAIGHEWALVSAAPFHL
ncbi:MAG: sulfatase-like hydrolase/transferase [Pseudomonadota bacterium]